MGLLLFYAFLAILISFLCSILEAVLLSVPQTYINLKKKEGKSYALDLEVLKKDVDKPLIAILTLNTIAHTVGAIMVGVQAKVAYNSLYTDTETTIMGMQFSQGAMVGLVSTIMTILVLIASEIIPKTIGANYWKQLSNTTTKILKFLVWGLKWTGLLWFLQIFTKLIGKRGEHESVLSREDFSAMTDIAHEEGIFHESESTIIRNLLNFDEILVKDVMTPRAVVKIASEEATIKEFFDANPKMPYSRIPVYSKRVDNITGFVLKDMILEEIIRNNGNAPLSSIKREILISNRKTPIPELFKTFIAKKEHIALVVDEYGSVSGVASMEDILETLLGLEIMDESDSVENLQHLARNKWKERSKNMSQNEKNNTDD